MAMKTRYQVLLWLLLTLIGTGYFAQSLVIEESHPDFLPGQTSHGHYQIELACESCHTEPFGSEKVIQNACLDCHKEELKEANDSHPVKKFTDPRNADRLEILDARYCVSCHKEHVPQHTREMGVTLPVDFCEACHADVAKERPSHEGMGFDTCASAGCHNYHDNKALYESFLLKHSEAPETQPLSVITQVIQATTNEAKALVTPKAEYPEDISADPNILSDWEHSGHAAADVNCMDCHSTKQSPKTWIPEPALAQCESCHKDQVKGFTSGKHGMKLGVEIDGAALPPMNVQDSLLAQAHKMNPDAMSASLTCNSCHDAHSVDRKQAAVESCLNCHSDEHSLAFESSKHAQILKVDQTSIVTCATCHLPETEVEHFGQKKTIIQHNQNHNLRPNEKMIRSVCLDCHSLGFSIDALADETLINNNFTGRPSKHIESIDMALEREKK